MSKNIILCSDGTGKAGGAILNTNVFQLYKAVDTQNTTQIAYYDDGIGSAGFRFLRLLSGAFGFGFQRNILSLYGFLARNYEPGDKVYMFGFSRGAATMRALAGMIGTIGLIKNNTSDILTSGRFDDIKFTIELVKAMQLYKKAEKKQKEVEKFKNENTHGVIDIEVVGVWDTVEALGFPQDSSWLVIGTSMLIDKVTDKLFPHRYYEFQLGKYVKNAYHALAIDDERKTFHPKVWDETIENKPEHVEQVWFAGAHSNVGGGMPRTGLAMITLDWMMTKASDHGIEFNPNLWADVKDGMNPAGKLYDSRGGLMSYYRYGPRHIRDITEDKVVGPIKIHESVFQRISVKPYAPIFPNKFEIVGTMDNGIPIVYEVGVDDVKKLKKRANLLHWLRTWVYHIKTEATMLTLLGVWYLNAERFYTPVDYRWYNTIIGILPSAFENFLYFSFHDHLWVGITLTSVLAGTFAAKKVLQIFTTRTRKKINWWLFHDFK